MSVESDFLKHKYNALIKLEKAKKDKLVDKDILPILDLINNLDDYYTSSSCYGRIVLLEIPGIGDKKNAFFLGKWHRKIKSDEILNAANKSSKGLLWMLAQSPILHVGAKTNTTANKILKTAIGCGFKNSGLKSIDKNIVVEIVSTERLDAPIGNNGKLFCEKDYLELLVNISNDIMTKSKTKLDKLEKELRKYNILIL